MLRPTSRCLSRARFVDPDPAGDDRGIIRFKLGSKFCPRKCRLGEASIRVHYGEKTKEA